jgi:cytochrome c oxidase subunit 2
MKLGRFWKAYVLVALIAVASLVILTGCSELFSSDQNTFAPEGDVAERQKSLFLVVLWPALIVGVLVFAGLIYMLVRYRQRSDDDPLPKQVHGNTRLEVTWTIAPALLLIGLAVPTIDGVIDLARAPAADAMEVRVTAFQFGWRFEYPDLLDAEGEPLRSDELHIPVDREVGFYLDSSDVIHSFWVPKLAGKTDVVPGRTNVMWFTAEEPGEYSAQCAEFCGTGHAIMRFAVFAETQEDFQQWVTEQSAPEGDEPPGDEPPDGAPPPEEQ